MSVLCSALSHFVQSNYKFPIILLNKIKYTVNMGKKSALLLIADGSEEMEAVITTDVLRRAGVCFFYYI